MGFAAKDGAMRWIALVMSVSILLLSAGCAGKNSSVSATGNEPGRDDGHRIKTPGPNLDALHSEPGSKVRIRKVSKREKNWLVDAEIRHADGRKERKKVLVDRKGRIVK